jgi:hypothetical protein
VHDVCQVFMATVFHLAMLVTGQDEWHEHVHRVAVDS